MRKILRTAAIVTVFLITMLALAFTASAGIGGISLSPYELPPNQIAGSSAASFNLEVTPGTSQQIYFRVRNGREYAVSVELSLNTAVTTAGGRMNYGVNSDIAEHDDSLQFHLDDIARFPGGERELEIEIPGRTSAVVPITLNIPAEGFDGLIQGGVHALVGLTEAEREAGGMIVNRFANIMVMRLRMEGAPPVEPDFTLGQVDADVVSAMSSFIARVHNPMPRLSAGALVSMWIIPVGADRAIFYHENNVVDFAPHGIFPFILRDRERHGIFPGDYIARIRVEYDGRVWEFEERFTVTAAAARRMAETAVGQAHMLDLIDTGPPLLTIVLISLAVLLLLAVIYLLLKTKKNQAAQQQPPPPIPPTPTPPANIAAPPEQAASNSALDKLKGMDEDKLAKLLEQMQDDTGNNEK